MFLLLLALALTGCASSDVNESPSPGHFLFAGPINAEAPVLSLRWAYRFAPSVDPASISKIAFDCPPIPGTQFTVLGTDPKIAKTGFLEGPVLAVSQDSTGWLLDTSSTTRATCQAVVSRNGAPDAVEKASVTFGPSAKANLLQSLKTAQEYNSKLPPRK